MKFHDLIVPMLLAGSAACSKSSTSSPAASPAPSSDTTDTTMTTPAAPTQLGLVGLLTAGVGNCTGLDLEAQDSTGAAAAVTNPETVTLTSSSATGAFYSDSGCSAAVTSASLPAGSSDTVLYYKDSTAGSVTITLADPGNTALTTNSATLTLTAIAELAFVNSSGTTLTQAANACGALTVATMSAGGSAVASTAALTLALSSTSATGLFYSDNACTTSITTTSVAAGQSVSSAVYYRDSADGTATISASESPAQNWTPARLNVTIAQ